MSATTSPNAKSSGIGSIAGGGGGTRGGGGIVVFGGGTATNSLVDVFESLRASRPGCTLSYVIPISDNGGSSSELIRVFGGPGIGDVRSRLVRLIPDSDTDPERASLKELFNHRLPEDHALARAEWLDLVESRHPLWWRPSPSYTGSTSHSSGSLQGISSEKRELIRSIFNIANMEIVKRAKPSSVFNFSRASIGNLFLTGARVLTGSLESAVYLLSTVCGVPEQVRVVPAINSNFTHHISAGLANGEVITGQNAISHPSAPTALPDDGSSRGMMADGSSGGSLNLWDETAMLDLIEDATLPGSLPTLRKPYITFSKGDGTKTPTTAQQAPMTTESETEHKRLQGGNGLDDISPGLTQSPTTSTVSGSTQQHQPSDSSQDHSEDEQQLPARIDRIWYINPYGHEIWPPANPKVVGTILDASAVIYSIGSLYTSIVPSLVLRGVGAALADSRNAKHKILILNSSLDRETSGGSKEDGEEFTAADFVRSIVRACMQSEGRLPARMARRSSLSYPIRRNLQKYSLHDDQKQQQQQEGSPEMAPDEGEGDNDKEFFDNPLVVRRYVTHLVYLEGHGAPRVDKQVLATMGVDCIRVYGRRVPDTSSGHTTTGPAITVEVAGKQDSIANNKESIACKQSGNQKQQIPSSLATTAGGSSGGGALRYDVAGLARALEAIVVTSRREFSGMRSRRNTSGQ